jgi:hypothetical protein
MPYGLDATSAQSALEIAEQLKADGVLQTSPPPAKRREDHFALDTPDSALEPSDCGERPLVKWRHITRFIQSILVVGIRMLRSMECAVKQAHTKKKYNLEPCMDASELQDLVRIFCRMRLFVYTADLACLFDSLVMLEFLRRFGFEPYFVIGVMANPFRAHAWLQDRRILLYGEPTYVQRFAPILVV